MAQASVSTGCAGRAEYLYRPCAGTYDARPCASAGLEVAVSLLQERFRLSELAERKAQISRTVDAAALKRFSASCDCREAVRVRLEFRFDRRRFVRMDGELATGVAVECHRCLEPVQVGLKSAFSVVLVASEAEASRLGAEQDVLCVDGDEAGIAELIEDELILALPERPCLEADCPQARLPAVPAQEVDEVELETPRPFAALGALKAQNN